MQVMDKVRWGMVGCGVVTEKKSGPGLYKSEHSELRAVFDLDYDKAVDYAKRHGVPIVYKTVEEMLADKEIDAIYLPTPPKFHKEYAIRCLEVGKIPYIEKPMAQTYEECVEIINKAKEVKLPAYVAFYRRGMDKYIKIKEIIENGTLGKVRFVQLKQFMKPEPCDLDRDNLPWRLIPSISGGGKFVDMVLHVLDVTEFLFGKITQVQGMADNFGGLYEVEDTVSATFKFESGIMGSGMWCYVADHNEEEMLIIGDKGRISTTGLFYGPIIVTVDEKEQVYDYKEPEHVAQPYIQTIVNELTGRGKSPANLESAANVIKVMDEILKEYKKRY
jgi:predicted dehydrogenase